jgi:hypothetical protein
VPAPEPSPALDGAALTRRAALLGLAGTTTAACSPYSFQTQRRRTQRVSPSAEPEPSTDPDVALAATVLAAEQAVLDRVDATLARHPSLERLLTTTRAVHDAHVELLADAAPDSPAASPTASPTGSPTESPTEEAVADRVRVPRDPARAMRALARHEDDLSLAAKRSAFAAESGAFARVLASMAAAAAQQSAVLRTARPGGAR